MATALIVLGRAKGSRHGIEPGPRCPRDPPAAWRACPWPCQAGRGAGAGPGSSSRRHGGGTAVGPRPIGRPKRRGSCRPNNSAQGTAVARPPPPSEGFRGRRGCPFMATHHPLVRPETLRTGSRGPRAPGTSCAGFRGRGSGAYGRLVTEGEDPPPDSRIQGASDGGRAITLCIQALSALCPGASVSCIRPLERQMPPGILPAGHRCPGGGSRHVRGRRHLRRKSETLGVKPRGTLRRRSDFPGPRSGRGRFGSGVNDRSAPDRVFFARYNSYRAPTGAVIEPNVVFRPRSHVGRGADRAFSHLEGCMSARDAFVGPSPPPHPARNSPGRACRQFP